MVLLFKVSMFLPRFCESWLAQMGGWRGTWEERLFFLIRIQFIPPVPEFTLPHSWGKGVCLPAVLLI